MNLFDLAGKVAVVTGFSRGIGRSIAENLARAGARVVISSRKADACEAVAEAIRARGGEAIVIPANIGDRAVLENLVAETCAQWFVEKLLRLPIRRCERPQNAHVYPHTFRFLGRP